MRFLPLCLFLAGALAGCQDRPAPTAPAPVADTAIPPAAPPPAAAPDAVPPPPVAAAADTADEPTAVLRRYYAAIDAHDYRRAYAQWGADGAASKQPFDAFAAGFAQTERVTAEVGAPGRVEGAAGSRYVEVPVEVRAHTLGGQAQHFSGRYVLRQVVADGATPEQRRWHLYSAKLTPAR